jgi:hypothetical protein
MAREKFSVDINEDILVPFIFKEFVGSTHVENPFTRLEIILSLGRTSSRLQFFVIIC